MIYTQELRIRSDEVSPFLDQTTEEAKAGLEAAIVPIKGQVQDFTPRNLGGMVARVGTRAEDGGMTQVVFLQGLVPRVHENNAVWSAQPPIEPLAIWAEQKLGVSEDESRGVAFAIAKKIKERGLTLPNVEGRGQMFRRTREIYEKTHAHFRAFRAAMTTLRRD